MKKYDNKDLKNKPSSMALNRICAIEWWESLALEVIDLQEKYYPYAGSPDNLTGYQIQHIFEGEIECNNKRKALMWWNSLPMYNMDKPNKRLFAARYYKTEQSLLTDDQILFIWLSE